MENEIRLGTSGNPPNFFKSKYGKDRKNAVKWIKEIGLNHYECLMTYGARMKEEDAKKIGRIAEELGVSLSVHAPYYVVLSSDKEEVFNNSVNELVKTLILAELMNARGVVFHPGFKNNEKAIDNCIKGVKKVKSLYKGKVRLWPETMGLKSQLGSLEEVLKICLETGCEPCIDFAHIHARNDGSLVSSEEIRKVILQIQEVLGKSAVQRLHCHFYPVEFGEKGEKKHRAFNEKEFYPQFKDFLVVIKEFEMNPTIVSESRDSQDLAALEMKEMLI